MAAGTSECMHESDPIWWWPYACKRVGRVSERNADKGDMVEDVAAIIGRL